jgi:hypothetical protein
MKTCNKNHVEISYPDSETLCPLCDHKLALKTIMELYGKEVDAMSEEVIRLKMSLIKNGSEEWRRENNVRNPI